MQGYRGGYNTNYQLKDNEQPLDTVSSIIWDFDIDLAFIATSWDGYVRHFSIIPPRQGDHRDGGIIELNFKMFLEHPVLCCDKSPDNILFAGLASGDIAAIDMKNTRAARMGSHDAPICGVFWLRQKGILMSLGFDNLIKFWSVDQPERVLNQVELPLKTHSCSFDWPFLLIGSVQSTISVLNMSNLPNVNYPRTPSDYIKINIEMFSKFNCSRIIADQKKIALGTVDGRTLFGRINERGDKVEVNDTFVTRTQKKGESRNSIFGQVNTVDIGVCNGMEVFLLVGGTDDLCSYNISRKNKVTTVVNSNHANGAITAARVSPRANFIVYATGTDWTKGIHQLDSLKKPKIGISEISQTQLKELTNHH